MTDVKRTPSYLPETWSASIVFLFHAPAMFLLAGVLRIPFMGQLFSNKHLDKLKTLRYNQILFFSKIFSLWVTRSVRAGSKFKDMPLVTLEGKETRLQNYLWGLPLVLNFDTSEYHYHHHTFRHGSRTPQIPAYNALVERYGQAVDFLTIYIREAHAVDGEWPQVDDRNIEMHTSLEDRIDKGRQLRDDVGILGDVVVDGMGDTASLHWGAAPESWALINPDGVIRVTAGLGPMGYDLDLLEVNLSSLVKRS